MRVQLKLVGLPDVGRRLGSDEIEVDLTEATVSGLVRWLQQVHGDPAGTKLLTPAGEVDPEIQVLRNGRWVPPAEREQPLHPGDEIALIVLVAGG